MKQVTALAECDLCHGDHMVVGNAGVLCADAADIMAFLPEKDDARVREVLVGKETHQAVRRSGRYMAWCMPSRR